MGQIVRYSRWAIFGHGGRAGRGCLRHAGAGHVGQQQRVGGLSDRDAGDRRGAAPILAQTMIVENLVMLPIGLTIAEMAGARGGSLAAVLAGIGMTLIRNPLLIAIAAGIAVAASGLSLPYVAARPVALVGTAAVPLALFVVRLRSPTSRLDALHGDEVVDALPRASAGAARLPARLHRDAAGAAEGGAREAGAPARGAPPQAAAAAARSSWGPVRVIPARSTAGRWRGRRRASDFDTPAATPTTVTVRRRDGRP